MLKLRLLLYIVRQQMFSLMYYEFDIVFISINYYAINTLIWVSVCMFVWMWYCKIWVWAIKPSPIEYEFSQIHHALFRWNWVYCNRNLYLRSVPKVMRVLDFTLILFSTRFKCGARFRFHFISITVAHGMLIKHMPKMFHIQ